MSDGIDDGKAAASSSNASRSDSPVVTSKAPETGGERLKFYPDEPLSVKHKYSWSSKEPSKFYDPCQECRQASLDCVLRNQEDRTVCQDFFDAYKECKKDFFDKRRAEKRVGKGGWGWT